MSAKNNQPSAPTATPEEKRPGINISPLDPVQRKLWVAEVANSLPAVFTDKFNRGQVEHNGDIGSVPLLSLLNEMEQEALDQLAYVREIKRRVLAVSGR